MFNRRLIIFWIVYIQIWKEWIISLIILCERYMREPESETAYSKLLIRSWGRLFFKKYIKSRQQNLPYICFKSLNLCYRHFKLLNNLKKTILLITGVQPLINNRVKRMRITRYTIRWCTRREEIMIFLNRYKSLERMVGYSELPIVRLLFYPMPPRCQ
jgi:hypothetical protein